MTGTKTDEQKIHEVVLKVDRAAHFDIALRYEKAAEEYRKTRREALQYFRKNVHLVTDERVQVKVARGYCTDLSDTAVLEGLRTMKY